MPEPTLRLTDDQIRFYRDNGFLAVTEPLTTTEEIDRLAAIYDDLFKRRAGRETGDQFDLAGTDEEGKEEALPQILGPSRYAPELTQGLLFANAQALAKQLLGEEAAFGGDHAIFKPAGTGAPTPWHQDEAYWDEALKYNSLSIWIPLQEATVENGCMQFIPGSHKWEVQTHHSIGNDPRIHGLEIEMEIDQSKAVSCPLPPGGATFHDSRTLHYTGANQTQTPRRAYILGFGTAAVKLDQPRDFYWNKIKQTARAARAAGAEG
jgi:ectoine hydroxylase-related dioxygenase (phytanoyl-CoA dioxygenase family)